MKTTMGSILTVAGVLAVTLAGCGGAVPASSAPSSTTTGQVAPATPGFKVVAQTTSERFDNETSYYVAIAPVDLSNDSFKQNVQLALQAVAKSNGNPNFSASVYDDETTAETAFSYYQADPNDIPADEMKTQVAREEQHLVAMYTGGIDINTAEPSAGADAYTIIWYPAATASSPNVGKYASSPQQWKP